MNRRSLLKATAGFAVFGLSIPRTAFADAALGRMAAGAANAGDFGIEPGAAEDQTSALSTLLERASVEATPIFLPPGRYLLSGLSLPRHVRLLGVPGATHLVQAGAGALLKAGTSERLTLSGLTLDGMHMPLSGDRRALLDIDGAQRLAIEQCVFQASGGSGLALRQARGHIRDCEIVDASEYALYALNSKGLDISANVIADCGNGGILVHRWSAREDGTIVTGNRVHRVGYADIGDGPNGCGISVFRADGVILANN
ncbi:TIGR03808 family TAT-translocated repetitive protein, partial [uncultured Nitratireductor sp.]|uniref:TIGR03808 family TAT-translocated repetitive protein n=1 Tax=uncultured Nitratireductor sp. TaxID=520953 RepID=UPI0025D6AB58